MSDQLKHFNGEVVAIRGRNAALATSMETISDASLEIDWSTQAATAAKVQITSSSAQDKGTPTVGTGAQTVLVVGLDANYDLQSESIITNGQAYVESTKSFIRVFAVECMLTGTGKKNAGDIYCIVTGTGGTLTGGVPATLTSCWVKVPVGYGYSTSGMYTVPRGRRMRLEDVHIASRTQQCDAIIMSQIPLSTTDNSYHWEDSWSLDAPDAAEFNFPKPSSFVYDEKTDIYMKASSATAAGVISMTMFLRNISPTAQRSKAL